MAAGTEGGDAGPTNRVQPVDESAPRPGTGVTGAPISKTEHSAVDHNPLLPPYVPAELDDEADDRDPEEPTSLEEAFEREYDELGPFDFAERVIQLGDRLGREGKNLPPAEKERALAEYSFLQDRLSFWLAYHYKPPKAQGTLYSAARALYQGAVDGEIVQAGDVPQSMVDADWATRAFDDFPSRARPPTKLIIGNAPAAPIGSPQKMEALGGVDDKSESEIADAPEPSLYIAGFTFFNPTTREATSAQTLNTLDEIFKRDHQLIYRFLKRCVDTIGDSEPRVSIGLDPRLVLSKTIHLAIPDLTLPAQWLELYRAIVYGKENGVRIVITRIRG